MGVGHDGRFEIHVMRHSFIGWPAIVATGHHFTHLFPCRVSNVIDKQPSGPGLEVKGERIAKAHRINRPIYPRGLVVERIVQGNRAITIEPQNLAHRREQRLRIGRNVVLTDRHVEPPVPAEFQTAGVVKSRFPQGRKINQHHLAPGHRLIPAGREATEPVVDRRRHRRIVNVHVAIQREIGIEGDPRHAPLGEEVDVEREKRRRQQLVVLDDPHGPLLFRHKNPAIRRKGHGHRELDPAVAPDLQQRKPRRQIVRRRATLHEATHQQPNHQAVRKKPAGDRVSPTATGFLKTPDSVA